MNIISHGIQYYIDRMCKGEYFAQVGYSDAEWYCMYGIREGEKTGLGQILSPHETKVRCEARHTPDACHIIL